LLNLLGGKYPRLKHRPRQEHNDDVEWQSYQDQLWSIAPFLIASDLLPLNARRAWSMATSVIPSSSNRFKYSATTEQLIYKPPGGRPAQREAVFRSSDAFSRKNSVASNLWKRKLRHWLLIAVSIL